MGTNSYLPQYLLKHLQQIESGVDFSGYLPRVESSSGRGYFVKTGPPGEQEQYAGEAESLKAIATAAPGLAPSLLSFGVLDNGNPYFISEYMDTSPLTSETAAILGRRLATELHADKSLQGYGFAVPTYCGPTRLQNGWFKSWEQCFSTMIEDLLLQLQGRGGYQVLCRTGKDIRDKVIPKLLGPLDTHIQPVLLHGDLWSGNASVNEATGQPFIFDPASYYGHNEADLSIARIFGGFPQSFYATYHQHLPKSDPVDQYGLRGDLYELFHYLNHTLIFGGHYARSAEKKMEKLLAETASLS